MTVDQYFQEQNNKVVFSRQQASDFAKKVADDFNPLHNINAKRFCVPGDLLFSMVLAKYGITKHMKFTFTGMVTDDVTLIMPEDSPHLNIVGDNEKEYLNIERSGEHSQNKLLIENLTRSYVAFSGHTFPHILVPLFKDSDTMINPDRPMVMYQSMLIDLSTVDFTEAELKLDSENTRMEVNGKRGNVCLAFNLFSQGELIGRGEKNMLLSGLRPYDQTIVDNIIRDYNQWKSDFSS